MPMDFDKLSLSYAPKKKKLDETKISLIDSSNSSISIDNNQSQLVLKKRQINYLNRLVKKCDLSENTSKFLLKFAIYCVLFGKDNYVFYTKIDLYT